MKPNYEFRIFPYDGDWVCSFPDLPGCSGIGDTEEEAFIDGMASRDEWLELYVEDHGRYPEPQNTSGKEYNGRILVRTTKSLHRDLAIKAEEEGVSLNSLCCHFLAEGLGRKSGEQTINLK